MPWSVLVRYQSRVMQADLKLFATPNAAEQAFVVTFGRAGEDDKKFKLGDADLTLQGFAGADYDLQVWRSWRASSIVWVAQDSTQQQSSALS